MKTVKGDRLKSGGSWTGHGIGVRKVEQRPTVVRRRDQGDEPRWRKRRCRKLRR